MKFAACLLSALLPLALRAADSAPETPALTILYTAETHGALLPCDCPLQPLGGVARRATAIKKYRQRGTTLLIDGGAWTAGGLYDEDSNGDPGRDSLRTTLMQQVMQAMSYTALVPTDSTQPSELKPPANANPALPSIFISRQGEEETTRFAETLPRDSIVFNAGRKSSQRVSWRANKATCVNFDFQAQRLVVVEVFIKDGKAETRVRQEALTRETPDDPQIAKILEPYLPRLKKKGRLSVDIEFWTMPECPGCKQLRPEIQKIAQELGGRVSVKLRFVTGKQDGKFVSLHGEEELNEARVQAVVQEHFPELLWEWLDWREANPAAPWIDGARKFGILPARIRGALSTGEADALLEADYKLALARRVASTPTLVFSNRTYDQPLERLQILRVLCATLEDPKPSVCAAVPKCFFDAQCRQRGTVGRCIDAGTPAARCDNSRTAVKVPASIIVDREAFGDNHERILEALVGDLPGLTERIIDLSSPEAREMLERLKITHLPAYVIDPIAKTEAGYAQSIGRAVREDKTNNVLLANPGAVGATRMLNRERAKGRIDLFAARLSKNGQESVETAIDHLRNSSGPKPHLVFHDALYWKENGGAGQKELAAGNGLAEIQEAAIAAAVKTITPEKYLDYLVERGRKRGALFWDVPLKSLGIDPEKIRALAETPAPEILRSLSEAADLLKSIDAGGDITVLVENCEVISVRSRQDLRDLMDRVGARKP